MAKRMLAWEDQAVQIAKKVKRLDLKWSELSVEMEWDGDSWSRLGTNAGIGCKMREDLREDLESKTGSANIVWKEGGTWR